MTYNRYIKSFFQDIENSLKRDSSAYPLKCIVKNVESTSNDGSFISKSIYINYSSKIHHKFRISLIQSIWANSFDAIIYD